MLLPLLYLIIIQRCMVDRVISIRVNKAKSATKVWFWFEAISIPCSWGSYGHSEAQSPAIPARFDAKEWMQTRLAHHVNTSCSYI
jgi:NADH:ubiquinone oxidoreductase subunit